MLYISRSFHDGSYGVVDSETGIESPADWNDISRMVIVDGLNIAGVTMTYIESVGGVLSTVHPYQDMKYYTKEQAKAQMLYGVRITTYKTEITRIEISEKIVKNDISLCLSRYGKTMQGEADIGWSFAPQWNGHHLTVVVDEHIDIIGRVPLVGATGVRWDMSLCQNDELIRNMAFLYYRNNATMKSIEDYLIDSQQRIEKWGLL